MKFSGNLDVGETALVGLRTRQVMGLACVYNAFTGICVRRELAEATDADPLLAPLGMFFAFLQLASKVSVSY